VSHFSYAGDLRPKLPRLRELGYVFLPRYLCQIGQASIRWLKTHPLATATGAGALPTDRLNTIVLIAEDRFLVRSEAMFEILARLPLS
jgi:hypothetical protein